MTTFARRFIGAAMLDAPTFEEVEADMTPPETVAKPPTITAISSDRVIFGRNGRTRRGASV